MFCLISERELSLTDRELKVFSALTILVFKNKGKVKISEICELTGKSRRQIIEILKNLIKKNFIRVERKSKYNHYFITYQISMEFNIELNFEPSINKKIIKLIDLWQLNKEQAETILNYIHKRREKIKDVARYFNYLAKNFNNIFEKEKFGNSENFDYIQIEDVIKFFEFQIYLNKNKIKHSVKALEYKRDNFGRTIAGKWIFEGKNIKKHYEKFLLEFKK